MLSGENKGVGPSGHLTDCHESGCKKEPWLWLKVTKNGIINIAGNTCRDGFRSESSKPPKYVIFDRL